MLTFPYCSCSKCDAFFHVCTWGQSLLPCEPATATCMTSSDYEICFRSCSQLACSIQKYMVFIRFRIEISLVIFNTYIPVYKQLIVRRNFVADAILIRKMFLKNFGVNLITTTILTDVNTDCAKNHDGVLK